MCLQGMKVRDITEEKYDDVISSINDMEVFGIDIGWLREHLEKVCSMKTLFASFLKVQQSEAQIAEAKAKYEQLLAEAKEKIYVLSRSCTASRGAPNSGGCPKGNFE